MNDKQAKNYVAAFEQEVKKAYREALTFTRSRTVGGVHVELTPSWSNGVAKNRCLYFVDGVMVGRETAVEALARP